MLESVVLMMILTAETPAAPAPANRPALTVTGNAITQQRNSIRGAIYTPERRPLENLRVELLDEVDGLVKATYTNGAGQFVFFGLSTGVFQVRVLTTGTDFDSRTERVTITGSIMGDGRGGAQSEQIDLYLRYKKGRGPQATTVTAAPGTVYAQEVPSAARKAYEQGLKELGDDKKDQALLSLQRAVELFPTYFAALDLLGQEYVKRGNYTGAEPLLARAVAVNRRSPSTWYALGYAQYKLRQLPAATESLNKSASYNPNSINTQLVLGTVQRRQHQWQAAETHLQRAKTLSKDNPVAEVHWQLALLYNQTNRAAAAADELELFLKARPDSRDEVRIRKVIGDLRKKK
ncbi:MAG TPA: tetratricopeptide repeat protein [Pyrinomonadaceae bacterium]